MRKIVIFDTQEAHDNLLPLSFTRPLCDFRVGITTLREKIEAMMPGEVQVLPVDYLRDKFSDSGLRCGDCLYVAGNAVMTPALARCIEGLEPGCGLRAGDSPLAFRGDGDAFAAYDFAAAPEAEADMVRFVFDIFLLNAKAVEADFRRLTDGRQSQPLPESNLLIGSPVDENGMPLLFIEEGASVEGATLNVKEGPIYIGKDAVVMEGATLRGPLALCANAKIKMGARIYSGSTFGPYCKVGGEVDNTVMFGYSNKAHDGYLGNAVIGEWCNIGAGVNASNLKNDYTKIRIWNYARHTFMRTDLQFCGLIMGDHSKAGVNCMFNTATVLGVGVNIHGSGFPRAFVPSFSEGSAAGGFSDVPMRKFYDIAERVMGRRGLKLTEKDRLIYERVREVAARFKG